jgi:hypothetical protein
MQTVGCVAPGLIPDFAIFVYNRAVCQKIFIVEIHMSDKMDYELKKTQIMFAADTKIVELPKGNFTLEVKGGDAWVFIDDKDYLLHEGETLTIDSSNGGVMRKLYHRGHVKYKISPLDDQ